MNYSSVHRVLFSCLSYPSLDVTFSTIVSVPVTERQKETLQVNHRFEEKGTTCWRRTAGTEAHHHTLSCPLLAFRSGTIRGGHMQGKGHVACHAASSFIGAVNSGDRWRRISATLSVILYAPLSFYSLQNVHFIIYNFTYTLYMICLANAPWELH